jgi:hypothetical protein
MHDQYVLLCANPDEMEARLDALRVDTVVIDHDTRPQFPHQAMLSWIIAGHPSRWRLDRTFHDVSAKGRDRYIRVYRRAAEFLQPELPVEVDMRHTLGRSLKLTSSSLSTAPPAPRRAAGLFYTLSGTANPVR